jgi:hypothetical protein
MQDIDRTLEQFHHPAIVSSTFTEGLCMFLKESSDGLYRVACFELFGEGMVDELGPCLFFIVAQGGIEEQFESRGTRHTHATSRRKMGRGEI